MLMFWQRKPVLSRLPNPHDIDKPLQNANQFKHCVLTLDTQNGFKEAIAQFHAKAGRAALAVRHQLPAGNLQVDCSLKLVNAKVRGPIL